MCNVKQQQSHCPYHCTERMIAASDKSYLNPPWGPLLYSCAFGGADAADWTNGLDSATKPDDGLGDPNPFRSLLPITKKRFSETDHGIKTKKQSHSGIFGVIWYTDPFDSDSLRFGIVRQTLLSSASDFSFENWFRERKTPIIPNQKIIEAFTPLVATIDDIPAYKSARFPKLSLASSTVTFSLERGYKIFENLGCIFLLLSLSSLKLHESQPVRIRRSRTGKITVLMTELQNLAKGNGIAVVQVVYQTHSTYTDFFTLHLFFLFLKPWFWLHPDCEALDFIGSQTCSVEIPQIRNILPYPEIQIHQMHNMKIKTNRPRAFRKLVLVHSPRKLAILIALLCFHGTRCQNFFGPGLGRKWQFKWRW
jgi:hypothetical protein